jgi:hypothetical protein
MTFTIGPAPSKNKEEKSQEEKAKEIKIALQAISGTKKGGKRNIRKTRRNKRKRQ